LALISVEANDPNQRTYDDRGEAIAAIAAANPAWHALDVRARADALTQVDEAAARSVVLDNGDWDGGLAELADPTARGVPVWIVRGEQATGSYLPDAALPAFEALIGKGHIATIAGGPHSPQRTHPVETTAALLRALEA
jgi:pimeloyl-ACP methyl ester carboxylesterase